MGLLHLATALSYFVIGTATYRFMATHAFPRVSPHTQLWYGRLYGAFVVLCGSHHLERAHALLTGSPIPEATWTSMVGMAVVSVVAATVVVGTWRASR